jgi:tRNA dimethylallyltransferase
MGYRQWREFFEGKISEVQAINIWQNEEKKYVKRQLIWFRKDKSINWLM